MFPVTRLDLLEKLVRLDVPLEPVLAGLAAYPWDCDTVLVRLAVTDVDQVLRRYLAGEVTPATVEQWADALECREDVDDSAVSSLIHELANPLLTRTLTPIVAQELLLHLSPAAV